MSNPTSAVTKPPQQPMGVIASMAARFNMDPKAFESTIRSTVFPSEKKDVSNEQLAAFLLVAREYELNPFIKEIYAYPNRSGGITPIVSVDGWHTLCNRHPSYLGSSQRYVRDEADDDLGVETTIRRKDREQPIVHTEWLSECYRNTEPWKMKKRMLGHKSFIQTARIAFGFAGIYDEDEGERIRDAEFKLKPSVTGGMGALRDRIAPAVVDEPIVGADPVEGAGEPDEPGSSG